MLGDLRACYDLGESYELGIGTPVRLEEAALTYQKSCDGNYAASVLNWAKCIWKMNHQSISIGTKLIQKGCNGGDFYGCFSMLESFKRTEMTKNLLRWLLIIMSRVVIKIMLLPAWLLENHLIQETT